MKSLWRLHGNRRLNAKVGVDSRGSVDLGSAMDAAGGSSSNHWSWDGYRSRSCSSNWRLCWWWWRWWNHSLNCQFIGIYNFTHFSFRSSLEVPKVADGPVSWSLGWLKEMESPCCDGITGLESLDRRSLDLESLDLESL